MQTIKPDENTKHINKSWSNSPDPVAALEHIACSIMHADVVLVILYISTQYDLDVVSREIERNFAGCCVIGCTSAGEIGPGGCHDNSIVGISFHREMMDFEVDIIRDVSKSDYTANHKMAFSLKNKLRHRLPHVSAENTFSIMLIDGISSSEEHVAKAFYEGLGGIALVGGSAGDDLHFKSTFIYFNGRFEQDAAVLLLVTTPFIFEVFKTQHFISNERKLVVTDTAPKSRIVYEINGFPASAEYARAMGIDDKTLSPFSFANYPVVVKIGGGEFVRSIRNVNSDGSLTFFCAIDNGIVFELATGSDLVKVTRESFERIEQRIGSVSLILGFDCVLRGVEVRQKALQQEVSCLMKQYRVFGFGTYGEQYMGIHVNQTFTGVAISSRRRQ